MSAESPTPIRFRPASSGIQKPVRRRWRVSPHHAVIAGSVAVIQHGDLGPEGALVEVLAARGLEPVTIRLAAMSSHTTAVPASSPASGLTRSVTAT